MGQIGQVTTLSNWTVGAAVGGGTYTADYVMDSNADSTGGSGSSLTTKSDDLGTKIGFKQRIHKQPGRGQFRWHYRWFTSGIALSDYQRIDGWRGLHTLL